MAQHKYIHLIIRDGGFTARRGLIPIDLLPADIQAELDTIRAYEQDGVVPRSIQTVEGKWTTYRQNPALPDDVHSLIQKWYTIMDCKPHEYGAMYMPGDVHSMNNDQFQEYQSDLHNNLPEWHKNTLFVMGGDSDKIRELLRNGENIAYKIEISD